MDIDVFLCNKNKQNVGEWITLPNSEHIIDEIIKEICPNVNDRCMIKEYKSELGVSVRTDDIYNLNSVLSKINSYATDERIKFIIDNYSNDIEEILSKV